MTSRASAYRRVAQEEDEAAISHAPHAAYALLDRAEGSWSPETLRGLLTDCGTPTVPLLSPLTVTHAVSHIEDELAKKRAPQFFLVMRFFVSRSPEPADKAEAELRVALPPPHASQRCLYALADDAPCLRGGRLSSERTQHQDKRLGDLTGGWTCLAQGAPLGVVERTARGQVHVATADASSVSKWNLRRERGLAAPWTPLSEPPSQAERPLDAADAVSSASKFPWPSQSNRQTAVDAVAQFLEADTNTSRYLVCPELAFGWDLDLLQDAINKTLAREASSSASRLGSFLAAFGPNAAFRSAQVRLEPRQPATALRIFEGRWRRKLLESGLRMYTEGFIVSAILVGIMWACVLVWAIIVKPLGIGVLAAPLLAVFGALVVAIFPLCEDQGTVHEGVGVAWALKRWSPTHFTTDSGDLSRDDILARLPGAVDARVQGCSWHALYGLGEEDWWAQNADTILNALRTGRRGALFLDEMPRAPPGPLRHHEDHEQGSQGQAVASSSREDPPSELPPLYSHNLHTQRGDPRDVKHLVSDDAIV